MPIYIGHDNQQKRAIVDSYRRAHGITHTVVLTHAPAAINPPIEDAEVVTYPDIIRYVYFYRLLQEIGPTSLVVVNECLRTQDRHDLTYNCVRHYLNRTQHQLVFQYLPQIDTADDFMILFDFDTQSRWKRRPFDPDLIARESRVSIIDRAPIWHRHDVPTAAKTRERYAAERERLFASIGAGDPHTLPRNLHLIGGADKLAYIASTSLPMFDDGSRYVARNARLRHPHIVTYDQAEPGPCYALVDVPHRFIDFSDFLFRTRQDRCVMLAADLPVDRWYWQRYQEWSERTHATCASLQP